MENFISQLKKERSRLKRKRSLKAKGSLPPEGMKLDIYTSRNKKYARLRKGGTIDYLGKVGGEEHLRWRAKFDRRSEIKRIDSAIALIEKLLLLASDRSNNF